MYYKRGIITLLVIVSVMGLGARSVEAASEIFKQAELNLSGGNRVDKLDWNTAGVNNSPNILSELTWDDLEIYQVKGKGKLTLGSDKFPYFDTHFRGSFSYGWIVDGDNQDSDYAGDNRTLEFSRSIASSDGDNVWDASVGIGPRFSLRSSILSLTPLVGYSYHVQNLEMTDGVQTVSRPDLVSGVAPLGPLSGLNSTYETKWYGPWLGIDLEVKPIQKLTIQGTFEYHWANYEAEADWNLRTDLAHPVSFEHDADGDGFIVSAALAYDFANHWSVEVSGDYQDWETDEGVHRIFFVSPVAGVGQIQLNEVNWESYSLMLGITYRFL